MPQPYSEEFRQDVVRVVRNLGPGVTVEQVATDFGVHPMTLWKVDAPGGHRLRGHGRPGPATESASTKATERLAGKRTTLVVAHRLSAAARADGVVVMDHGRVAEDGTHAELVARGGRYADLWRTFEGEDEAAAAA